MKYVVAAPFFYLLFVFGLSATGLLGPDEPRYASIAREMARSGDWITPRLWGDPWFEKPPLLYWMGALGFRAGLGPELAPRLPVALASLSFLIFFFVLLRREFGELAAFYSTVILATSAGWVAFSHAAATDLPLAAAFGASMLLAMVWLRRESRLALAASAIFLGLAILAKGLVPLVLSAPLVWFARRRLGQLVLFFAIALFTAAPWYAAVTLRHGFEFIHEFFWRHHFERFASESLQHVRPFWFYVPVFLAGIFPWTPLLVLLLRPRERDGSQRFFAALVAFGFVFFSVSTNKLPGYLLPLFPPLSGLLGIALAEAGAKSRRLAGALLALCAAMLALVPVAAGVLPRALESGLSRAPLQVSWAGIFAALALSAAVWWVARQGRPASATAIVAAACVIGVVYLKTVALPEVDRAASARMLWRSIEPLSHSACISAGIHRGWRYGLNYYSEVPLPPCPAEGGKLQVDQQPGRPPRLVR